MKTFEMKMGENTFTKILLIERALEMGNLVQDIIESGSQFRSGVLATYPVTHKLVDHLIDYRIKAEERPDGIFTVTDEITREYWNFFKGVGRSLEIYFEALIEDRGVRFCPRIKGSLAPCSRLAHFHLSEALVIQDENSAELLRGLTCNKDGIFVEWKGTDLEGVKELTEVFREFFGIGSSVWWLAQQSGQHIFDPCPPFSQLNPPKRFLTQSGQNEVSTVWSEQLEVFKSSLTPLRPDVVGE